MKVTALEVLRCDGGWRNFAFLKISTDAGIVGWAEVIDRFGNAGMEHVIAALAPLVVGKDPTRYEAIAALLQVKTRQVTGGLNRQAMGAIENALLDITAKARGLPVYALFGGPVRERIPIYWSHCGTWHISFHHHIGVPQMTSYAELSRHAERIRELGFNAIKTHIHPLIDGRLGRFDPGFGVTEGWPELNPDPTILKAAADTLRAIRAGAGEDCELMMDANFHFRTEGFRRLADAIAPFGIGLLELDTHDPDALASLRRMSPCPITSCETLCGRREFKRYLELYAVDVPIIDVVWNGLAESLKIAAMAECYEMNVAPHNYRGHLATMMAGHFGAVAPNLRAIEFDVERVPWLDDYFTAVPEWKDGHMIVPAAPGWGIDVNETAVRARPARN